MLSVHGECARVSHLGCRGDTLSMAGAEITPCAHVDDLSDFGAIDDRGVSIPANSAMAKECMQLVRYADNTLTHAEPEDQHSTPNTLESTAQTMPLNAAYFYDALRIPHTHIFSRSGNPWLGVAVASSPIWFLLPYNVMLYGYLQNYHPVVFPFGLAMVAADFFHISFCLRFPPDKVNKSVVAMISVLMLIICFTVPCLGALVLSTVPGGHRVPGGSLLAFCSFLFLYIYVLIFNVRFLSSCRLPVVVKLRY